MSRFVVSMGVLLVFLCSAVFSADRLHGNMFRYDFQIDAGEGTVELYRVEYDYKNKKGQLCFLNTGSSGIPSGVISRIRKGEQWSKLVEMSKESHACFRFDSHDPFGWFYSPPFVYEDQTYIVFFIGDLNKNRMKGTLYQFIVIPDGTKQYRLTEERLIDAIAQPAE